MAQRASRKDREETVFNVGRTADIKDYVKNACKRFPNVAWAELRAKAVEAFKELEAKKTDLATEVTKDNSPELLAHEKASPTKIGSPESSYCCSE